MKKILWIFLSQLMVFSISAQDYNKAQDSLIKKFLRFVPDSMALESVENSSYKDKEVEKSWILITKDVGAEDYEEADDDNDIGFWNAENQYCRDLGARGLIVLFKYKSGEYYKVVEKYNCLDSGEEDGGVYFAPEGNVYLDEDGVLSIVYGHGRYGGWRNSFKYINGEFKYIGSSSSESMSWIAEDLSSSSIDYDKGIAEDYHIINVNENFNENGDYNDDFVPRYIYHTYEIFPTYLPSINEVEIDMGKVTDLEKVTDITISLLKIEVDDYKIVNGEREWHRREITNEEAEEIEANKDTW
ncbi:MAG: hypothetical protein J6T83_08675 [Paludibacteraceae bacterium]|nr:hypothetical protein [Paludibacteraceae bacterium]